MLVCWCRMYPFLFYLCFYPSFRRDNSTTEAQRVQRSHQWSHDANSFMLFASLASAKRICPICLTAFKPIAKIARNSPRQTSFADIRTTASNYHNSHRSSATWRVQGSCWSISRSCSYRLPNALRAVSRSTRPIFPAEQKEDVWLWSLNAASCFLVCLSSSEVQS